MTVEDWEVGALYWRLVDEGASPEEAAEKVKQKFLGEICAPEKETYFYVGTVLKWPKSWVVIGAFYPRYGKESRIRPRRLLAMDPLAARGEDLRGRVDIGEV